MKRVVIGLAAVIGLMASAGAALATLSVYTYHGPSDAIWNQIYEGPDTFGPRYYNRVYRPTGTNPLNQMCLRYHYNDGSYTPWQCNYSTNPFYAYNGSGGNLTAYPAKAQCKYYFDGGLPSQGLANVTCQTTVGLP
ncbi:MAG TPA: hypothetical protein VF101_12455 [Gaiellaceae bacterium]